MIKLIGASIGIAFVLGRMLNLGTTEVEWAVGTLLVWGWIYTHE